MKKLKVFGGLTVVKGKQVRTIVATTSKKKAAELVGESIHQINTWWEETGNATEVAVATAKPDTVFVASSDMGCDFKERRR
jgi:hypothetical protein